jgi:hypothetical protein
MGRQCHGLAELKLQVILSILRKYRFAKPCRVITGDSPVVLSPVGVDGIYVIRGYFRPLS